MKYILICIMYFFKRNTNSVKIYEQISGFFFYFMIFFLLLSSIISSLLFLFLSLIQLCLNNWNTLIVTLNDLNEIKF